jgi:putative transposase
MKKSRHAKAVIVLRPAEDGVPFAQQTPRKSASFYKWRAKYGGMDAYMISQIKTLEDENRRQTDGLSM